MALPDGTRRKELTDLQLQHCRVSLDLRCWSLLFFGKADSLRFVPGDPPAITFDSLLPHTTPHLEVLDSLFYTRSLFPLFNGRC